MKDGDKVRCYINSESYLEGVVVEECGDGTVWVEHSNGQQIHYKETDLILDAHSEIKSLERYQTVKS